MDFKSIRAGLQVSAAPRKLRDLGKSCRKNKKLQDINEECRLPIADSKNQGIGFLGATLICGPARFDLKSIEERSHAEAQRRRGTQKTKDCFSQFSAPLRLCVSCFLEPVAGHRSKLDLSKRGRRHDPVAPAVIEDQHAWTQRYDHDR